jgi:hypothetical protein
MYLNVGFLQSICLVNWFWFISFSNCVPIMFEFVQSPLMRKFKTLKLIYVHFLFFFIFYFIFKDKLRISYFLKGLKAF